jgi:hypothetical protein
VILCVIIAGVIAIAIIALREMGITIPPWFLKILMIVAVVIVAIIAIRFIASL